MEHVKPSYTAPVYPVQPMPMPSPAPAPMPMPMPQPVAPIMNKPVHNDIHLHASYQQTSIIYPKPVMKPAVVAAVAPAAVAPYSSAGSILVLFILLVIITRGFLAAKC
ncbi:hypothetical protein [Paenibacillus hexagrammi]|uniref:Uncharacterized protein n=1 Tax=Paenibacillus hexagrammi TaxID=2908839 RepID=A0ABY3SH87_9BACL|nr:hypothetical protein [Paenibacillus sp. YPD9-1]UJF32551.1 hypothetical protein L0M14_23300 [Paenibacillus sp. YPD9-1]